MNLVALKPSIIVPRTTTWGPLSDYKWWMHEVTEVTSSQDKVKKKALFIQCKLGTFMMMVWKTLTITHHILIHHIFIWQCLIFSKSRRNPMFSKSDINLPWVNKYKMATNWRFFLHVKCQILINNMLESIIMGDLDKQNFMFDMCTLVVIKTSQFLPPT